MPPLARNAPKLLRRVGGKAHASAKDHEEEVAVRNGQTTNMAEEDIYAEPKSSDDESQGPPPSQTSQTSTSTKPRKQKTEQDGKGTRRSKREAKMRVPTKGVYEKGRAHKAKKRNDEEKENMENSPTSTTKREAEDPFGFGMAYGGSKRQKTVSTATPINNIHTRPNGYSKKTSYGKAKTCTEAWVNPDVKEDDEDIDNVSMLDAKLNETTKTDCSEDLESSAPKAPPSPAKAARPDLLASLSAYKQIPSDSANHDSNTSGANTPLPFTSRADGALDDTLQALEQDVADMPADDDDTKCALCQEFVDPSHASDFWKYKRRTVKNQTLFCKEHKQRSALVEYKKLGLPEIDWDAMPKKIRKHRPQLVKLLKNETVEESEYRKRHAAKLQSGKATALPPRRRGKRTKELEEEILDVLEPVSATGFYGPRGKRLMMEVMTTDLSDVIREVSLTDPVVGRSGFAVFVSAVLVPELTILLAMDDLGGVSKAVAKEKIAKSEELGVVLHEELDDEVKVESDEDMDDRDDS